MGKRILLILCAILMISIRIPVGAISFLLHMIISGFIVGKEKEEEFTDWLYENFNNGK